MNRAFLLLVVVGTLITLGAVTVGAESCPPTRQWCDGGDGPGDDEEDEGGGGGGPTCPVEDGPYLYQCWELTTGRNSPGGGCSDMEIEISREVYVRHPPPGGTGRWELDRTEYACVEPEDAGLDPWEVWAGVGLSSGGIGSELPGTEEIPIWTGYENGFWFEGDTEASDSDSATEPRTGLTVTVEVRAWPSEVTIDTGDDGPLSGGSNTASYTLSADGYGAGDYGSAENPLFRHMYETKGTDAGHDCACFIASIEAMWSGEYRWSMGGVTTDWEAFPNVEEADPIEVPLQVWEVIGQLR